MDLSRQLCELAGIKPTIIYIVCKKLGGCWNRHLETSDKEYVKSIFTSSYDRKELKIKEVIFIYPDFKLPENFVKLLECLGGVDKKAIIYSCIEKIKEDGQLKQALQAQDWRY